MSIASVLDSFLRAPSGFVEVRFVPFGTIVGSVIRSLLRSACAALMGAGLFGRGLIFLQAPLILVAVLLSNSR